MNNTAEFVEIEQLRYPIGQFEWGKEYTSEELQQFIKKLERFPQNLKKLVTGLTKDQLDTSYREGGWTIRQIVHHLFDSHMNAYTRFKLTLTEDTPTIKPYNEKLWAELEDSKTLDPEVSLMLIDQLHKRWTIILNNMTPEDFNLMFFHPEHGNVLALKEILAMYAWHCDHHYAHIQKAKEISTPQKRSARKIAVRKKSVKKHSGE